MRISPCLVAFHIYTFALADFHQCSTDPKQQPYRWLTDKEFTDFAAGIIDDMFEQPPTKREESRLAHSRTTQYKRQTNGNGGGGSHGSDIELQPPSQQRLSAGDTNWASFSAEHWETIHEGLRTAQEQTINQLITAVAEQNREVNRRALAALDQIGEAAANSVTNIGNAVQRQVNALGSAASNQAARAGQRFEQLLTQRLAEGANRWATEMTATTIRAVNRIADGLNQRVIDVVESTADAVTQGNTAMDVRAPLRPFDGRFRVLNNTCRWLYWCGSKFSKGFRCVFLCNMNAGDRATRTRTACQNFLAVITLSAILVGGLVLVLNRLNVPIPGRNTTMPPAPPPEGTNITINNSTTAEPFQHVDQIPTTLNIRVEPRGPPPPDMPVVEEPMITQLGDETLPQYAAKWLTHPNRKLGCTDPPKNTSAGNKQQPGRRDDPNDNRCVPTHADDLQSLVWNLMWTQFLPQLDKGVMSASYSLYDEALEGSEDIYKGGGMQVHFWVTEKPDIERMKAPVTNDSPSWSYREPTKVYGQECFDTYFPAGADPITDGVPTKNWIFAFADACKNVMGKKSAIATDFIYAGKGYNSDPQNGVGFNGTYHTEGCQDQIKCTDLVGLNGDGVSGGDIQKHFDHCKSVTKDGKYHGGMFYHSKDQEGRYGKRDDPWVPNRCGYMQIEPLGDDGVDVQTGKKGPQLYGSDELR